MSDSPEEVRARIHAEELAKGSDPRVAEARAKAAEARAKEGLPIDPQEAWKAKLAKAGGTVSQAQPAPQEAADPAEAPADQAASEQPQPEAEAAPEPDAPSEVAAQAAPAPDAGVAAGQAPPAPEPEPAWEPEVGDVVEPFDEPKVTTVAGIKVADSRIPARLMLVLLIIPMWAILYLLAAGSSDVGRASTGCVVSADHSFVCFQPRHEEKGGGGGH